MTVNPDVDQVAAALYGGVSVLARRLRKLQDPGGLSLPERAALSRLDRGGAATAAELARAEQITAQAMGITLAGLEERGLVERRPDPEDRRRVIMSVTSAGRRVLRDKRDARAQHLAKALGDGFTRSELATLYAAASLIERLGERI